MKTTTKYILASIALLALIIACTKEVGLYTEVEFEISETHVADGFVNTPLATSITVTPEELVEGYSYTYSYKINTGEGYFEDEFGATIAEGDKIGLSPLSASLNYIATKIGDHSITFTAEDTFGFQEQVTVSYVISDVPVSWTAIGPTGQVLLGSSQDISITLGSETTTTGVTYERNYSFTQGTGTITSSPSGTNEILNEFVSITPGTYALTYVATELGQTTLEFLLKDSNGQEIVQTISFEVVNELSTEKEITSFIVNGVEGTIVGTDIAIELPEGTDLTTLSPVIIHNGASISPESETSQDFTNPVIYTVTAQDQTIQTYTVNVTVPSENQYPTAIATSDVTSGAPSLAVQFTGETSSDPDTGDALTYAWDFGDGSTATTPNPSHTFTTAGTYTVTLTVTDDGTPALNSTDTITIIVTDANQAPTAVATSDITSGEVSLAVQFTGDTSSDPDSGDVLTYAWDFGDGSTATTANPSHTFTIAGTYDVTLTVTDDGTPALSSSEVTITITVNTPANQAPTAVASSDVTSGEASLDVQFTGDTSSDPDAGDVLTYAWDFGDGSTATTANPAHTFTTAGTYDVTLTVTDDGTPALSSSEVTITITVTAPANQAPTAVASSDVTSGEVSLDVQFTGDTSSDPDAGDVLTYAWDFGDGTTATTANPAHTFTTAGTYDVTLTVTDDGIPALSSSEMTITITVNAPTNQAPMALPDLFTVIENSPNNTLDVLDNDSDADGTVLTIIAVDAPINGTATIVPGGQSILYTATTGNDRFDYTIEDEDGATTAATIDINVVPNQNPTVEIDDRILIPTTDYPRTVTFNVASSGDTDGTIENYQWNFGDIGSTGNIINNTNPTATSHTFDDPGTYDVVLTVTDDLGGTGFDTVQIVLDPVQEPGYSFFIDPIPNPVTTFTQEITFRIIPNAAAIAQGIKFTMRYEDRSGLANFSSIKYDGQDRFVTQSFSVNSGTTSGILQGPFSECEDIEYEFIVSSNLVLPDQTQTVSFLIQNGSSTCR
ncbi:PKD domain-containing protein [Cellulophaga baltica]|uniref:PKD domain-containing protein n=1 Tax=Cellulophaga baltica TaxID=76594 RepID=UPI0004103924|nr:PKD domain-containing protein [Cellulophaga baltica]